MGKIDTSKKTYWLDCYVANFETPEGILYQMALSGWQNPRQNPLRYDKGTMPKEAFFKKISQLSLNLKILVFLNRHGLIDILWSENKKFPHFFQTPSNLCYILWQP